MLHLEIVTFITKKPFQEEGYPDFYIQKFEIYRMGGAFAEEPLLSQVREIAEFNSIREWPYEIGFGNESYGKHLLLASFNVAYDFGGANPNAIDKVRIYKDVGRGDWDLVWTWVRGKTFVKWISL